MLKCNVIQPSVSPWVSPVVLVSKPHGSTRFCCDFQKLNLVTKKDSYPLSLISKSLKALNGTHTPPQWIWCPVIGKWNLIPGQVRRLFSPIMQVYMSSLQCCLVFVMPRVRSSTYPDFMQPFLLSTDASNDALGMVLGQKQNGHKVVIAYGGSKLNPAERNYSVTEREALAVVTGIKQFQHYLHRCKFTVLPDHNAACWLMNIREPTGRLGRWTLVLQQYDFEIVYRAGKNNGNPDG